MQSSRLAPWALAVCLAAAVHSAASAAANEPKRAVGSLPPPTSDDPSEPHHAAVATWLSEYLAKHNAHSESKPARPQHRHVVHTPNVSCHSASPTRREYLMVVIAGDGFNASEWMNKPELSSWDLVVIYHGESVEAFVCAECKAIHAARGAKWHLLYQFTLLPEWQQYRQQYRVIMLPDDDLQGLHTCTLNTLFDAFTTFDLMLAQPSVCDGSWTEHGTLYQNTSAVLHYTNFVEVMAPMFRMDFFDGVVRRTLHNAYFGWGLDWAWGFMLRNVEHSTAVLDVVCMTHMWRNDQQGPKLYEVEAPIEPLQEMYLHNGEYEVGGGGAEVRGFVAWQEVTVPSQTPVFALQAGAPFSHQALTRLLAVCAVLTLQLALVRRWRAHRPKGLCRKRAVLC